MVDSEVEHWSITQWYDLYRRTTCEQGSFNRARIVLLLQCMSTQRRESRNYINHQSLNARAANDQIDDDDNGDECENVEYEEEDEEPLSISS